MSQFISVIKRVFPVFLALVLGYLCKRRRIISPEGIEGLKKLSMSFALPATLFGVFFSARLFDRQSHLRRHHVCYDGSGAALPARACAASPNTAAPFSAT